MSGPAKLLRIFVGESDKIKHKPLYEVIVTEARARHLAGATAWKGVLGFGAAARIRSAKLLDLSADLPVIIEIVDEDEKIDAFLKRLDQLFDEADSGGLITIEKVQIVRYLHAGREP